MQDGTNRMTPAQIVEAFIRYLNDEMTVVQGEEILQILLRTDKVIFGPEQVARIVHQWATRRVAKGDACHQSYCLALLRIYQANQFCPLPHFQMNAFLKPFLTELLQLCPADERDLFKSGLPKVKEDFQKSMEAEQERRMPEYEVQLRVAGNRQVSEGEWIRLTSEKYLHHAGIIQGIIDDPQLDAQRRHLRLQPEMAAVQETFENIIHETVLKERLTALAIFGKTLFNRQEIASANLILSFVAGMLDQKKDQFLEREVASIFSFDSLDPQIVQSYLRDPARKKALKPIFSNILELRPLGLLGRLAQENDAEKRRQLLSFITVYEPEIYHVIVKELDQTTLTKWYYRRNLIYLLPRIQLPAEVTVDDLWRLLIPFVHPEVHSSLIQESIRSLLHFDPKRTVNLCHRLIRAEHISEVISLDHYYPPEKLDEFLQEIIQTFGGTDISRSAQAVGELLQVLREEVSQTKRTGLLGGRGDQKQIHRLLSLLESSCTPPVGHALKSLAEELRQPAFSQALQELLSRTKS